MGVIIAEIHRLFGACSVLGVIIAEIYKLLGDLWHIVCMCIGGIPPLSRQTDED